MKMAYITAAVPWGNGESFIIDEMLQMKGEKLEIVIIPRNPSKEIFHQEARKLVDNSLWLPLVNLEMLFILICTLFTRPKIFKLVLKLIVNSRSFLIFIKNIAVLPKGVYLSRYCKMHNIEHIHAHWGSTTATLAYIISEMTDIPWSFTVHRWDITENNMLKTKVASARFIRCISQIGLEEVISIVGEQFKPKVKLIHMGVHIGEIRNKSIVWKEPITLVCPANLLLVKGGQYLIDACKQLVKEEINNFRCIFIGDGPMETELKSQVKNLDLEPYIQFIGRIPHDKLMRMYASEEIDIVVLPSINTDDGEHEGIPVALMEAMAYSIPVISTNTGGIPELLNGDAGYIVEEKNPLQLAYALRNLITHPENAKIYSETGYMRIYTDFNIIFNTKKLLNLIEKS